MYYCLVKNPEKKTIVALVMMVCVRVVGLVCHPPAAVNHGRLIALAHSARSFTPTLVDTQFQSVPLLPRLKKQNTAPRSLRC